VATLDRQDGIDKPSGMDTSVILGVLHGHTDDGFLSYSDPRVLQTASRMEERFKGLYPINGNSSLDLGPAIGRYPEDIYGGAHFDGGNPWILLTAAFGQFYYRVGQETLTRTGNLEKVNSYLRHGDAYLNRVRYHASNEGKLDEQMDRYTGMLTSARDLTWSYAETLEALRAHDHLRAKVRAATAQNCPELLLN
jgi:glucoamylase